MSDPLSVAGSVAGVISLGAATSKLVYQFVSSIRDAPKDVQAITRSLYSVNIALCQIQTLLLDLTYASETTAEDLGDLEKSVLCCVGSFNVIENWLRDVCPDVTEGQLTTRRAWQQIKYVFQKDSLEGALERLENEKGALQLILTALNSKSTGQILKVVKNTGRAVQRNTQVIKRLELLITRETQDIIGRSHTTTSSISLDSICTQVEIERLLTDSGSTLSLTLSDVSDDAASIIVIPDSLSSVNTSSLRIKFPTVEGYASAVKHDQETKSTKHGVVPISAPWFQDNEGLSRAPRIIDAIEANSLTAVRKTVKEFDIAYASPGNLFTMVDLTMRMSKLLLARSTSQNMNLENARRCIERFEFYSASFRGPGRPSIQNSHLQRRFIDAQDAIEQYGALVEKAYGGIDGNVKPSKSFVSAMHELSGQFEERWLKVEASMNELEHSISLHVMIEQRQLMQNSNIMQEKSIHHSQLEGLQMQKSIEEKVDASHKLLEAAISRMDGNRHPKSKAQRKNQRGRAGGRVRKDKASPGRETIDPTAKNGQTSTVSESTGEVGLDEWELSHDEASER